MVQNVDPIFLEDPKTIGVKITAADTTTKLTAFTAGVEGGAVITLSAVSFDAADVIVVLHYNDGTTSFQMAEITVPAGAGTDGTTPPVDLFNKGIILALDADQSFILKALSLLQVAAKVTVGGDVHIVGIAGDY